MCAYVTCLRGKLIAENKCGLTLRRITVEKTTPNDFKPNVKLKNRDLQKFGSEDVV
jgi:hypothetical protein